MNVGDKVWFVIHKASFADFPYEIKEGIVSAIYAPKGREDRITVKETLTDYSGNNLYDFHHVAADRVFHTKQGAIRWLLKKVNDWRNDCYDMLEQELQKEYE